MSSASDHVHLSASKHTTQSTAPFDNIRKKFFIILVPGGFQIPPRQPRSQGSSLPTTTGPQSCSRQTGTSWLTEKLFSPGEAWFGPGSDHRSPLNVHGETHHERVLTITITINLDFTTALKAPHSKPYSWRQHTTDRVQQKSSSSLTWVTSTASWKLVIAVVPIIVATHNTPSFLPSSIPLSKKQFGATLLSACESVGCNQCDQMLE